MSALEANFDAGTNIIACPEHQGANTVWTALELDDSRSAIESVNNSEVERTARKQKYLTGTRTEECSRNLQILASGS